MSDGKITTLNLGDFKLPCAKDIPKLDTVFASRAPRPIGELPNVPTAAAIANAVAASTTSLTAEKVMHGARPSSRIVASVGATGRSPLRESTIAR